MLPSDRETLAQRLHVATAELGDRYGDVLPREAVAEIVQAAALIVLRERRDDQDLAAVTGQIIARARGDLAMAAGAPACDIAVPAGSGVATAWTYVLDGVAVGPAATRRRRRPRSLSQQVSPEARGDELTHALRFPVGSDGDTRTGPAPPPGERAPAGQQPIRLDPTATSSYHSVSAPSP